MNKNGAVVSYTDPDIAEAVRSKQLKSNEHTQLDRIESMLIAISLRLGINYESTGKD